MKRSGLIISVREGYMCAVLEIEMMATDTACKAVYALVYLIPLPWACNETD